MTLDQVMTELAAKGSESIKRIYLNHGAKEPFFGIKISDLKLIHKKIKGDQVLALQLYESGNGDAQYLAGMVASGAKMTAAQLESWAKTASWRGISGTIVPWVASEHPEGLKRALKWIDSPKEGIAIAGWHTLGALVATRPDAELPIKELSALLDRVAKTLKDSSGEVRYAMNSFVIACGTYVTPLADKAIGTARKVGKVEVERANTACQVPDAESYILKCRRGAPIAPKRKTMRC
jgi:3-methyladenine DNA glycosylase AlkD